MRERVKCDVSLFLSALMLAALLPLAGAYDVEVHPDRENGTYEKGEQVAWRIAVVGDGAEEVTSLSDTGGTGVGRYHLLSEQCTDGRQPHRQSG